MTLSHEACHFMYQLHHFLKGLRQHRQRTFVAMLSRFWLLRGWGSLSEAVKKKKNPGKNPSVFFRVEH